MSHRCESWGASSLVTQFRLFTQNATRKKCFGRMSCCERWCANEPAYTFFSKHFHVFCPFTINREWIRLREAFLNKIIFQSTHFPFALVLLLVIPPFIQNTEHTHIVHSPSMGLTCAFSHNHLYRHLDTLTIHIKIKYISLHSLNRHHHYYKHG